MPRSCWPYLMAVLLWSSMAATLPAADDFWALLQDHTLEIAAAVLIANDGVALSLGDAAPYINIDLPPSGDLQRTDNGFLYIPKRNFFGIDGFRYSWIGPSGIVEGVVELLVVPWIIPLAGPMGLLQDNTTLLAQEEDGVGYYNSYSGTFYFCSPSAPPLPDRTQPCTAYRYPDFEPGWLPLIGTWQDFDGTTLPNRPGLYDPNTRQVYLLDGDPSPECSTCDDPISALPLRVLRQFVGSQKSTPMIPLAADLHYDGYDSVIFFRPRERRYDLPDWSHLEIPPGDSTLWPLTVPGPRRSDNLAVFGQQTDAVSGEQSGNLHLLPQYGLVELWSGESSLATVRQVDSSPVYEVYDAGSHSLSTTKPQWHLINDICVLDGTQLLLFPSDPDPPPNSFQSRCQ